jgi:hypothetical protein
MREREDVFLPQCGQVLISRPELVLPDDPANQLTLVVTDQHPVTPELTANGGSGRIDGADKPIPVRIFLREDAFFFRRAGALNGFGICFGNIFSIFRQDMDQEKIPGDAIPAIVVPFSELAFYPDKFPKTPAALPAPVTHKFRHRYPGICGQDNKLSVKDRPSSQGSPIVNIQLCLNFLIFLKNINISRVNLDPENPDGKEEQQCRMQPGRTRMRVHPGIRM